MLSLDFEDMLSWSTDTMSPQGFCCRANGDMDGKPEKSEQGTNEREPHLLWIEEYQVLLPLVTGTVVLGL